MGCNAFDADKAVLVLLDVTRRDWQIKQRIFHAVASCKVPAYPWPTARRRSAPVRVSPHRLPAGR